MTSWVRTILFANIIVFFVQYTMPELTNSFVFVPSWRWVLTHPWSIVTYMFMHAGISHIFWNMLGLYFFGSRVEARLGAKRFLQLYFISGISGAILSFVFSPGAAIVGASAAIFGIMMAFAMFWPRDQIMIWGIIPIEARWLVVLTTIITLFSIRTGADGGVAHFAHLGGYIGAFLFLRLIDPAKTVARFRAKTIAPMPNERLGNWKKVDLQKVHEVNREELNRILDKINTSGLASLTPTERLFLSNFVPADDRPQVS
jgi:membrane associated rhomboid family serine protease